MWWREVNEWGAAVGSQAGWHGGCTRGLWEVPPPALASSHGMPAVCLLCCAESACSLQLCCFLSLSFPQCLWLTISLLPSSSILAAVFLIACGFLCQLPPAQSSPTSTECSRPPPHHPVARIMALLTTQAHGGSGFGLAKSSQSLTSITSLVPLCSLGRVSDRQIKGMLSCLNTKSWLYGQICITSSQLTVMVTVIWNTFQETSYHIFKESLKTSALYTHFLFLACLQVLTL